MMGESGPSASLMYITVQSHVIGGWPVYPWILKQKVEYMYLVSRRVTTELHRILMFIGK